MANMSIEEAFRLAVQHHTQGRPAEAENIYRQIISQNPNHADSYYMLAALGYEHGRGADALPLARRAVELSPGNADFHILTGVLLATTGQTDRAIESFQQAAALRPNDPASLNNLANALRQAGRPEEALQVYQQAQLVQPDFPEVYANMSNALLDLGRAEEAIDACKKAITLQPGYSGAYNDMGNALKYLGRYDEAIGAYKQAIAFQPSNADAVYNLANAQKETGDIDQALSTYRQALSLRPNFPSASWNLALTQLLQGDYQAGWEAYESRWQVTPHPANHGLSQPFWDGSNLDGKSILLHTEQGLGDAIQFARYVPQVKSRGGVVHLLCQPQLKRLFEGQLQLDSVTADEKSLPGLDVQLPLMSLPRVLGGDQIPSDVPYLRANPTQSAEWKSRVARQPAGLKVGLVWSGRTGTLLQNRRALSLDQLAPLSQVPGVQFYSLQKGDAAAQTKSPPPGMSLTDFTADLSDFADTAALIDNLDLVISVDTAAAHLAGAMGKKVWIMIPYSPDWRWHLNRTDSPWYPTARLFRQPAFADWTSVVRDVADALRSEATLP
jgi:tetratricopeptide (TPR) repeat protein